MPTTTNYSVTPAPNATTVWHVTAADSTVLGRIRQMGRTYRASRIAGAEDDMRRVSQGFRSVDAAAAWIAKAAR